MNTLEKNMFNLFGDQGCQWLDNIAEPIEQLTAMWQLSNIMPVDNMTFNYVVKAKSKQYGDVVLKLSCNSQLIDGELHALHYFAGQGMVELLSYAQSHNAMLLQQLIPGCSLRTLYPDKVGEVITHYASVVEKLASAPSKANDQFKHIREWLTVFERLDRAKMPRKLLDKAIQLSDKLLASSCNEVLLHGDLHHDNILRHNNEWLAIDPKGVVGEVAFEVAAFDFILQREIQSNQAIVALFHQRVAAVAHAVDIDQQRLKDWVYVRLMLGACWMIEDNGCPDDYLTMINAIFRE